MTLNGLHHITQAVLPRRIGFWGASGVMLGIIIGSGIFRAPASIAAETGQPGLILLLWLAGGLLSLCGAFTYAELATMFPQSGGVYVFLREAFGPCVAFVFGWTYMLISKPAAAAGIAVIFAEHVNHLCGTDIEPPWIVCTVIVVLTALNTVQAQLGSGVAAALTALKVAALLAIIVLGFTLGGVGAAPLASAPAPKPLLDAIAPILSAILWTYDGWSDVGAIAGEVKKPQKLIPRIFIVGTTVIIGIYVAVNAVYLTVLPLPEMRGINVGDNPALTIAPAVMQRLIGPQGAVIATLIVILATLGSTHGSIMTGARVTFAQARDGLLFRFLARVHSKFETPAISLWVQAGLSCAAVLMLESFEKLTGAFIFTMWIFYGLAAAAIFVLRYRRPNFPRPYRCVGYPVVPAFFILSTVLMTALLIRGSPGETLIWIGILLAGVPIYYLWRRLYPPLAVEPGGSDTDSHARVSDE